MNGISKDILLLIAKKCLYVILTRWSSQELTQKKKYKDLVVTTLSLAKQVKTVLKKIENNNNTDLPGPTKIRFGLVVVKPKTNQLLSFLIMLLQISKLVLLMTTIYTCLLELENLNLDVIQNSKRLENKISPRILLND